MKENLQPNLQLTYCKVIRPTTRKTFTSRVDKKTGKVISEQTGTEAREYREYRETRRDIKGVITPRKIQMYRWHYRYLQLALNLELLDYSFAENRRIPGTKKRKGYFKTYRHKVVVNRNRYEGWDLDELLTTTFDRWWSSHSYLFVETPEHAIEIQHANDMLMDDHYRYFRIDTRMTTTDTIRSLKQQLDKHRRSSKWTSKWVPTGEIRQEKLFNCYNALVMWLEGKTTKQILTSNLFRTSRGKDIEYVLDVGSGGTDMSFYRSRKKLERSSKVNLDKMKDLLGPARRLVLIAADGYFAKHPRNKKYFGDK